MSSPPVVKLNLFIDFTLSTRLIDLSFSVLCCSFDIVLHDDIEGLS